MADTEAFQGGWRAGLRIGAGLSAGSFLLAVSFGAFAVTHGWPAALTIAMSLFVFSGSAQYALVATLTGGGIVAAVLSASLINLRFVPMGAATARHLSGGRWQRAVEGQAVVDGSWVAAQRPEGGLDRPVLIAATLVQWPLWVAGTTVGALAVPSTSLLHTAGLDLVFPGFFAVLLVDSLAARPRLLLVGITAAVIAGVVCRYLPAGVGLLAASSAALLVLVRRAVPASGTEEAR